MRKSRVHSGHYKRCRGPAAGAVKDVTELLGARDTAVRGRLRGRGRPPGFDHSVAGCGPRPGLPVESAVTSDEPTFLGPTPCRSLCPADFRPQPRRAGFLAPGRGLQAQAARLGRGLSGAGLLHHGRTLEMWAWRVVGGGVIREALGLRAAPSRAGGSGRGARQRRGDWLRRAETSGSRGPSGRPARRGAVGSSGLVTGSCSRPCRSPPPSLGCAAAVARTRRRAPRRLQPRGLRSPQLPHAHHDED